MTASPDRENPLARLVREVRAQGGLVVQPRMGFSDTATMRAGLRAVAGLPLPTVGTLTVDSYTRVGDHDAAGAALREGRRLNGFPIVSHGAVTTAAMTADLVAAGLPVQVRHGSAAPYAIVATALDAGLTSTEGGPVSYCLPYGRVPLAASVDAWRRTCDLLAERSADGVHCHLESFGGCLLGQLCPPSLLLAVSLLEGLFFRSRGVPTISLSYAQQTNPGQDLEALRALTVLAHRFFGPADWHIVLYTYMGVFPSTTAGALRLIADSAQLAVFGGAHRLIVKTPAEAYRIPTIDENVDSLLWAHRHAAAAATVPAPEPADTGILAETTALVESVLALHDDVGEALVRAFRTGALDVPYCLHDDNAGRSAAVVDTDGLLRWTATGRMALPATGAVDRRMTSDGLLAALSWMQRRYDDAALLSGPDPTVETTAGSGPATS
ncbi:methylaspartate mutase [Micromonospora sp. CA-240977]|uniref:methylaspartate mutase n=1 Tax=Micromonospora sp. CA-240977 TaxID=3239957 RepID=UPI003D94798F